MMWNSGAFSETRYFWRSRRRRGRCDPSSMRPPTEPLDSPALTFVRLPNRLPGPKSATKTLQAVLVRLRKRKVAKGVTEEKIRRGATRGKKVAEEMSKK